MIGQLGKFLGHWSHWGSCYHETTQKVKEKIAGFPQLKVTLLISPWSQDALHEKEEHDGGYPANSHNGDVKNIPCPPWVNQSFDL